MLKKEHRLLVQQFRDKRGQTKRGIFFHLKVFHSSLPHLRVGAVVSKAVAPKATGRNRIKRFIFDFFKAKLSEFAGQDIIVIAQPSAGNAPHDAMIKELSTLIKP